MQKLSAQSKTPLKYYTTAIMRGVPSTLTQALSMSSPVEPITFTKAKAQHDMYVRTMKTILPSSIELDADGKYPDCVFIEDTAVVIDDKAVITRIGAESRIGEVEATKEALLGLGLSVYDMRYDTDQATCDGGDVLYPVSYVHHGTGYQKKGGKHLFVGISSRTNHDAAEYLQRIFPHVEVIPVDLCHVTGEALHLKSIVTHIDEKTLLVPMGKIFDDLCTFMRAEERGYEVVRLPDIAGCNVCSVNGYIIASPTICDESKFILQREVAKRGMTLLYVDASEFAKCDGALTCKSILIPP